MGLFEITRIVRVTASLGVIWNQHAGVLCTYTPLTLRPLEDTGVTRGFLCWAPELPRRSVSETNG